MPPKPGRRRATRATARRSTPATLKNCATSNDVVELDSAPPNDAAFEAETEKITAKSAPPPEKSSGDAPAPSNDAALEERVQQEVQNDAVLVSVSETLAEPVQVVNEGQVDREVVAADDKIVNSNSDGDKEVVGGGDDRIENSNSNGDSGLDESGKGSDKEVVVVGDDKGMISNSNGGKAKKMVKKTVKVVKKVIKRVPKRVLKGGVGDKVENFAEVPVISGGVEDEGLKQASSGGQLNVENSSMDASVSVKTEEEGHKIEIDEKKDGLEGQEEDEKEKEKESGLMEVDNNVGGSGVQTEKGVAEKRPAEVMDVVDGRDGECGTEKEETDAVGKSEEAKGKEEVEGEEDVGNVGGREYELGEGKLFRGELEAMERRKRRKTEIFIGGLDRDAKAEDVRKVFAEAGEIVDLTVVMDPETRKNKGFAFLRYASATDAKRALEKFSKVKIRGKQCRATPVEGNDTIYLGNIDKKWKEEDVVKRLQEIRIEKIDKVTVMVDPENSERNRGFAFIELETSKDAQIAYRKLQTKKDIFVKNRSIKVAWAEPLKELNEDEMLKVKTVYAEFIPSSWDEEKVRDAFKKFGEIDDIVLSRSLRTTKRKDFAFISYKTREAAIECIESFNSELRHEDGTKVNVKVSLAKPMQKSKQPKPVTKPVAKEAPRKKPKFSQSHLRLSEPRNRAQPAMTHYDIQIPERSSRVAELIHLSREQDSWRPSHASLSNSPMDINYSNSLPGRKRQFSMLEADPVYSDSSRYPYSRADPLYSDSSRYPYSRLNASFPVASSSHNAMRPSSLTSSLSYQQQHNEYPSAYYGARNYPSNTEIRDRAHGSNNLYRRY